MNRDEKPDGWIADHADKGFNFMTLNCADANTAKMMHVDEEYGGNMYDCDEADQAWNEAEKEGWQIKPVKLIEFEKWEKIQEWIKNVREYFQASVQGKLEGWECEKHKLDKLNNFLPEDK